MIKPNIYNDVINEYIDKYNLFSDHVIQVYYRKISMENFQNVNMGLWFNNTENDTKDLYIRFYYRNCYGLFDIYNYRRIYCFKWPKDIDAYLSIVEEYKNEDVEELINNFMMAITLSNKEYYSIKYKLK